MTHPFSRLQRALADRYTIEGELGRGGMAMVYAAEDLHHHRRVAIKILRPELVETLGPQRFLREIDIVAHLNHPHILALYDSGVASGFLFYVMPVMEGESLRERIDREKQLSLEDALRITSEVADALAYAGSHGLVHRDIKPANVLLHHHHAVVADFGIATAITAAGAEKLTGTGLAVGTPAYMSPEQAAGVHEIDSRSDQYSLACVLYEMLVGEPPFSGPSTHAILARHAVEPVPSIRTVRHRVPAYVDHAVQTALAKTPADRFATVTQFAEALGSGGVKSGPAPQLVSRRKPIVAVTLVLALVVVGFVVAPLFTDTAPPVDALPELDRRHVAVLRFDYDDSKPEMFAVIDSLQIFLISELSRSQVLTMIPPRGSSWSSTEIIDNARELNVGTVIHGSLDWDDEGIWLSEWHIADGNTGGDSVSSQLNSPVPVTTPVTPESKAEALEALRFVLMQVLPGDLSDWVGVNIWRIEGSQQF